MANFNAGWSGKLRLLKVGGSSVLSLPTRSGSGYSVPDNMQPEMLGQGSAQNAYPINYTPGITTPSLYVTTRLFANWFDKVNLKTMLDRDTSGDFSSFVLAYEDGSGDVAQTVGKLANFRLEARNANNQPIDCGMTFLCTGVDDTTSLTAYPYVPESGSAFYFQGFTPLQSDGTTAITHVEYCSLDLYTGASWAKWADGTNYMSNIDPGILTGTVQFRQRPGATYRLDDSTHINQTVNLKFASADGLNWITFQLKLRRVGRARQTNTGGAVTIATTWAILGYDGTAPLTINGDAVPPA